MTAVSPANNANDVAVNNLTISVDFSKRINTGTVINGASFKVATGSSAASGGSFQFVSVAGIQNNRLIFHPRVQLVRDTTYTVTLTDGITDLAGNHLVPFGSTFTTEAPVVTVDQFFTPGFTTGRTSAFGVSSSNTTVRWGQEFTTTADNLVAVDVALLDATGSGGLATVRIRIWHGHHQS